MNRKLNTKAAVNMLYVHMIETLDLCEESLGCSDCVYAKTYYLACEDVRKTLWALK